VKEEAVRVELRRFLGGVPFSHVREITPTERKALLKEVAPYGVLSLVLLVVTIWGIVSVASSVSLVATLVTFMGLSIVYCVRWMWPHVQTLRTGQVYVYIGRMNDLTAFDLVQEHYRGQQQAIAENMDRYIEILATGKGDRLWQLEGIPNQGALKGVRSRWLALVPDHDESGTRALSPEETKELRLRTTDFIAMGPFVWKQFVGMWGALHLSQLLELVVGEDLPTTVLYGLIVLATLFVWAPYWKRLRFARMLMRDARAGMVEDGHLASGMPWVVEGEPARWRVGTAKGTTSGVTIDQAWALEALARPEDEDDLKEYDEELASPTKA
jgi:hypothetical protein